MSHQGELGFKADGGGVTNLICGANIYYSPGQVHAHLKLRFNFISIIKFYIYSFFLFHSTTVSLLRSGHRPLRPYTPLPPDFVQTDKQTA